MGASQALGASFRDPSGFLFQQDGRLYRQVNKVYQESYEQLMSSGLYADLVERGLLIPHDESDSPPADPELAYKVIEPERVPFISYPYEWCFSQLKDAALATLQMQKIALERGMSLKDASAYNIQFPHGGPALIDTLSFEPYREGEPWTAYRQFCQHFLAPLALMALRDIRLGQLLRVYVDGVPLDLAAQLLPRRTYLNFALLSHLHLHAAAQRRYAGAAVRKEGAGGGSGMSRTALLGLVDSLEGGIRGLHWKPTGTEWGDYYDKTNYSEAGLEHKRRVVQDWTQRVQPGLVWDLGANTGVFTRQARYPDAYLVSFDIDPAAVELNYRAVREQGETDLLPLVLDLTNPSPSQGWSHHERDSILERGPADLVLALALVHHLAISNNVPLDRVADFFADAGRWLIIEFVPKKDSQVERLLASREDIFGGYTQEGFEEAFRRRFTLHDSCQVEGSVRTLYLMERKD